jgi:hypothetical protein
MIGQTIVIDGCRLSPLAIASYRRFAYPPLEGEGRFVLRRARREAGWGEAAQMVSQSIRRAAANKLRANTTPHERMLWRALREIPVEGTHFRRQAPIGPYIVDFFCPAKRLIIS